MIFRDQEHSSHLLDPGCLPGSGMLYRIWEVISRDQEQGSRLLDLGCLPGSDFTEFRRTISSGYYLLVGARFPFTGSGLSAQIQRIILELGNNFRGPGVQFSFTGSRFLPGSGVLYRNWDNNFKRPGTKFSITGPGLSSQIQHILQDPGCLTQIHHLYQKLGNNFLRPKHGSHLHDPGSVPGSSIFYRNWENSVQIGNTVRICWI